MSPFAATALELLTAAAEAEGGGTDVGDILTSAGLLIGALAGAYATIVAARRAGKVPGTPPPPPPADADDELLARLWFELLARGEQQAAEVEALRRRNLELERDLDAAIARELDALRRAAGGPA